MDIYFCDICASRVSAQDLKSGKGMRRRHDVVCSGCIDAGRHQAWMARAGSTIPITAAPIQGDSSAVLTPARDRARTAADLSPQPPATAEDVHADTARVERFEPQLAAAATSMTALAPRGAAKQDEVDDLAEMPAPDPAKAETGEHVAPLGDDLSAKPAPEVDEPTAGSPFASGESEAKPKEPGTDRNRKSGLNAKPKSGSSSRVTPKPGSGKSSRRARATGITNQQLMMLTGASLLLIVLIGGLLVYGKTRPKTVGGGTIVTNALTDLNKVRDDAQRMAQEAMRGEDLPKVEQALAKIRDLQNASERFEKDALKAGWTQKDVEDKMESIALTIGLRKALLDMKAKLSFHNK